MEDGTLQDPAAVAKVITTLVKNLKLKGKKVAISVSGYSVIVKKINLAVMSDEELEKHIESEAEQYIPFDIDDVYLDYQDLKTLLFRLTFGLSSFVHLWGLRVNFTEPSLAISTLKIFLTFPFSNTISSDISTFILNDTALFSKSYSGKSVVPSGATLFF